MPMNEVNDAKMKNRLYRYDINRPRLRHGYKYTKYKMCFCIMMVICIKQQATSEVQFMKKLSNTEAELEKQNYSLFLG